MGRTNRAEIEVEIQVAWGEMDAYQHVNNAVFLRWFETARISWLDRFKFPEKEGKTGPVLRAASVEYLLPVAFPDMVTVRVWLKKLGNTSVTLAYEVSSAQRNSVIAKGNTVVVYVDHEKGKSRALTKRFLKQLGET